MAVAVVLYSVASQILAQTTRQTFLDAVTYVHNSINEQFSMIHRMLNFFFVSPEVKQMLLSESFSDYAFLKSAEGIEQLIQNNFLSENFQYITEIQLFAGEKSIYTFYQSSAALLYSSALVSSEEFRSLPAQNGKPVFITDTERFLTQPPVHDSQPPVIILRTIKDAAYMADIGSAAVCLDPEIFEKYLMPAQQSEHIKMYIADGSGVCVAGTPFQIYGDIGSVQQKTVRFDQKGAFIAAVPLPASGWILFAQLSSPFWQTAGTSLLALGCIVIVSSVIIAFLLWRRLSGMVLEPVGMVSEALTQLVGGTFIPVRQPDKRTDPSARELISNFNYMVERLQQLIDTNIIQTVAAKEAEYKALQAQINPHFLYNTLNSIRWMAIISKADNIKLMTEVLVRLLRNTLKKADEFSTIAEELANVRDYIFIEQIAYHFKFTVDYDIPDQCLSSSCIKFLLQPIVENAILHGLGEKEGSGCLKISAQLLEQDTVPVIQISIFDDGAGIDSEILNNKQFSGIGIHNVEERIKQVYGSRYGLSIQSTKGEYTEVIITIPQQRGAHE